MIKSYKVSLFFVFSLIIFNSNASLTFSPSQYRNISVGSKHSCGINNSGIYCWGRNDYEQLTVPNNVINPIVIKSGSNHNCVLDDEGVKCWGSNEQGQSTVPDNLNIVRTLWAKDNGTCVVTTTNKTVCWGTVRHFERPVPYIRSFGSFILDTRSKSSPIKYLFLTNLLKTRTFALHLTKTCTKKSGMKFCEKSFFGAKLLNRFVSEVTSEAYSSIIIDNLANLQRRIKSTLRVYPFGGGNYDLDYRDSRYPLSIIKAAITTSEKLLTLEQRKRILPLKKALVLALRYDDSVKFLNELDKADTTLRFLKRSSKSKFLYDIIHDTKKFIQ